jgi:hypothetical protein
MARTVAQNFRQAALAFAGASGQACVESIVSRLVILLTVSSCPQPIKQEERENPGRVLSVFQSRDVNGHVDTIPRLTCRPVILSSAHLHGAGDIMVR